MDETIASYKKAIALDPKYAGAYSGLGYALDKVGRQKEAIEAWREAVRLEPRRTNERYWLGKALLLQGRPHEAARLWAAAFAADPKLANDLKAGHRYNAAGYVALAAAGQGEDAAKLDDKERKRLRQQARDWLRADLVLRGKQLETGKPADRAAVQQALRHWQKDSDLAGIRDAAALAKLPAEERAACAKLWADVAALLKKAETPAHKETKR